MCYVLRTRPPHSSVELCESPEGVTWIRNVTGASISHKVVTGINQFGVNYPFKARADLSLSIRNEKLNIIGGAGAGIHLGHQIQRSSFENLLLLDVKLFFFFYGRVASPEILLPDHSLKHPTTTTHTPFPELSFVSCRWSTQPSFLPPHPPPPPPPPREAPSLLCGLVKHSRSESHD